MCDFALTISWRRFSLTKRGLMRHAGRIIWFNRAKGYGILACDREGDVLFDARHVPTTKRPSMRAGDSVWFEIVHGETGPEAKGVSQQPPSQARRPRCADSSRA